MVLGEEWIQFPLPGTALGLRPPAAGYAHLQPRMLSHMGTPKAWREHTSTLSVLTPLSCPSPSTTSLGLGTGGGRQHCTLWEAGTKSSHLVAVAPASGLCSIVPSPEGPGGKAGSRGST